MGNKDAPHETLSIFILSLTELKYGTNSKKCVTVKQPCIDQLCSSFEVTYERLKAPISYTATFSPRGPPHVRLQCFAPPPSPGR